MAAGADVQDREPPMGQCYDSISFHPQPGVIRAAVFQTIAHRFYASPQLLWTYFLSGLVKADDSAHADPGSSRLTEVLVSQGLWGEHRV